MSENETKRPRKKIFPLRYLNLPLPLTLEKYTQKYYGLELMKIVEFFMYKKVNLIK